MPLPASLFLAFAETPPPPKPYKFFLINLNTQNINIIIVIKLKPKFRPLKNKFKYKKVLLLNLINYNYKAVIYNSPFKKKACKSCVSSVIINLLDKAYYYIISILKYGYCRIFRYFYSP